MRQKDIEVGATYYTKIGETLCAVIVVAKREPNSFNTRATFQVRRVGESTALPKWRTAAALRVMPKARLDTDRTAVPKTRLVAHVESGMCVGNSAADELVNEDGSRTKLF